jgi:hypothetical protein
MSDRPPPIEEWGQYPRAWTCGQVVSLEACDLLPAERIPHPGDRTTPSWGRDPTAAMQILR